MAFASPSIASQHYPAFRERLPSLAGKTVCITGTTSGTGLAAAKTVAGLGAKVVMLNRESTRSATVQSDLSNAHPDAAIHTVACDLQSFASVRAAGQALAELCPEGVHVLCNNAGVMAMPDVATEDGFDIQMQTNHLSHFLLTREAMPLLERAAQTDGEARIVNHSSIARMGPKRTLVPKYLEKRGGQLGGDGWGLVNAVMLGPRWVRYNQSKLANCAFTAALHERLTACGSSIKALVAHPGFANTNLQKTTVEEGGMGRTLTPLMMKFSQSIEDGALGILSAMCLAEAKSGQFYGPGATGMKGAAVPFALEAFYDNAATRDLLWSKSEEAIGGSFPIPSASTA